MCVCAFRELQRQRLELEEQRRDVERRDALSHHLLAANSSASPTRGGSAAAAMAAGAGAGSGGGGSGRDAGRLAPGQLLALKGQFTELTRTLADVELAVSEGHVLLGAALVCRLWLGGDGRGTHDSGNHT